MSELQSGSLGYILSSTDGKDSKDTDTFRNKTHSRVNTMTITFFFSAIPLLRALGTPRFNIVLQVTLPLSQLQPTHQLDSNQVVYTLKC